MMAMLSGNSQEQTYEGRAGKLRKSEQFSLKAFLNVFGDLLKLKADCLGTEFVRIKFPNPLLQTQYITEVDIDEYFPKLRPASRQKLIDTQNFLIVQALETDSMEYSVTVKRNLV